MQATAQKSRKSQIPSTRIQSFVRGSLDRIAQRRYTRDLFDDIVNCPTNISGENSVTDEEKLLTLLRCFNNFFNKKFDAERMFRAINSTLTKENTKVICTWLNQKNSDNIYVIGRFILHIASFLESQRNLHETEMRKIDSFLSLIFCDSSKILDENLILIFSFLCRKGYFRSSIGFIMLKFDIKTHNLLNLLSPSNSNESLQNSLEIWIHYLRYPLSFAVKWRTKVEEWIKSEAEKVEMYGSNGDIDEEYSTSSIMNLSLMSASSEFNNEDPSSRQTRLFLKGLLSSWCNSVYFNDNFYQYCVTPMTISLANSVLINTVPIYLIILALVEPIRQRRKYSLSSLSGNCKTLLIQYKLNANPSLGLLSLLANEICQNQLEKGWIDVGQEEAYGILVCLHLCIFGLFENPITKNSTKRRNSIFNIEAVENKNSNDTLKSTLNACESGISKSICHILRIALSGPLDPDVVLPLACLYRNLQCDLKVSEKCVLECRMLLSKKVAFIRYLWSLCQTSTTTYEATFVASGTQRRISDVGERFTIIKILSEGKLIPLEDIYRFLSVLSTLLECVTFHLNTLYLAETHRKSALSSGPLSANFLLWPELWNMANELAALSIGLIKIALSLVNPKNSITSSIRCQVDTGVEIQTSLCQNFVVERISEVMTISRIFYIQIEKLNPNKQCMIETRFDSNIEKFLSCLRTEEIKSIFNEKEFPFQFKEISLINETNFLGLSQMCILRQLPQCCKWDVKKRFIQNMLEVSQYNDETPSNSVKKDESVSIEAQSKSIFRESFSAIGANKEVNIRKLEIVIVNGVPTKSKEFFHRLLLDGLDPRQNLFSCDANQLLYPNPYVENFYPDYKAFYEFLGKIFAINIIHGNQLMVQFAPFFLEKLMNINGNVYNINDLNTIDVEVAKNLLLLSKTDEDLESFNFRFVITQNTFGKLHTHEVVPGGANIPVTFENKSEYFQRVVEFILDTQIKLQCLSFKSGISTVFPAEIFNILSSSELNTYLRGELSTLSTDISN